MSYANGTTFYNLPQTVGTDKRDWFDTNQAFADIDEALHGVVAGQSTDADNITNLQGRMTTAEGDITALQGRMTTAEGDISTLQGTVGTHTSQIADVRQDAEDMITAYNEGAAETSTHAYNAGDYFIYNDVLYKATDSIAIGDTIVPNTNCVATNVTTEVNHINSDLSGKASASDLSDLAEVVAGKTTLLRKIMNGTTNADGNIVVPDITATENVVIAALVDGKYVAVQADITNDVFVLRVRNNDSTMTNYSNSVITAYVYYF